MIHSRFVKFIPIINVWEAGVQNSIMDGVLRLQVGQWVRCGDSSPSRFVKATRGSLWVVHGGESMSRRFAEMCSHARRIANH